VCERENIKSHAEGEGLSARDLYFTLLCMLMM